MGDQEASRQAEQRVQQSNGGSQYGSIDQAAAAAATVSKSQAQQTSDRDLQPPPKPAVRQRTSTSLSRQREQNNNNNISQNKQDLCGGPSSAARRGSSVSTRDELNRELQAELGRKLSLARSRLEQSQQLDSQVKAACDLDPPDKSAAKTTDLSLSLSLSMSAAAAAAAAAATAPADQKKPHADKIQEDTAHLPPSRAYPKKVFFIIANEFCERFSYYGLRAVLVLYLTQVLSFTESNSTITFHLFATLCYVTPILGAILGDSILGKFKTIFYLSIVYFFGELILVLSSVFWQAGQLSVWSTFAGLLLIGFGTGGIKPCVSALGGDQFMPHEEKWRQSFFSIFYAAINLGSLITVFVTPLLRTEFKCVGRQDCFPYAFGLPCLLMFLSIVVFLVAKNQYYLAPLPEENVIVSFCQCIWVALKRKIGRQKPKLVLDDNLAAAIVATKRTSSSSSSSSSNVSQSSSSSSANEETLVSSTQSSHAQLAPENPARTQSPVDSATQDSERRSHWLYLAADRFDSRSIEAFRSVLGILLLFVPTLVYWCLFDQQGSLWTLQATRMDGHIFGGKFVLQPDQMGVANPLILLALIPVFEVLIYPGLAKCNLMRKPLQRMTVGGFVAALAFLSSAAVELRIQQNQPAQAPPVGSAQLILVNGLRECSIVHPTISHIQMPDVLLEAAAAAAAQPALISVANQSLQQAGSALSADQQASSPQTIRLESMEALAFQAAQVRSANSSTLEQYQLQLKLSDSPQQISSNRSFGCPLEATLEHQFSFAPIPDQASRLLYLELGNGKLTYKMFNESLELPPSNKARLRLLYEFFGSSAQAERRQFRLLGGDQVPLTVSRTNSSAGAQLENGKLFSNLLRDGQVLLSQYVDVEVPASGALFSLESNDNKLSWTNADTTTNNDNNAHYQTIFLEPGTRNLLLVHQSDAKHVWLKHQLLQDNKYRISMLYQLIPYTLISMSEVMFSITGLEFSYSMAPASMKSVLLAIWSLTIAFGNLLTVFVESLHLFSDVAHEFLFYAALMAVDMCIFAIMGYNFRPNKYHGQ